MASRWSRVVRGFIAAVISTFVAAACHITAGGNVPVPAALVACLVLSTFVCVALTGKRLSLLKLSVSVSASQLLFHGVFSMWMPQAMPAVTGHVHEHFSLLAPAQGSAIPDDTGMWLAHALAAFATIVALRHGEKAFFGLLTIAKLWIGALFERLIRPRPIETPLPALPPQRIVPLRDLLLQFSLLHHRGPPVSRAIVHVSA